MDDFDPPFTPDLVLRGRVLDLQSTTARIAEAVASLARDIGHGPPVSREQLKDIESKLDLLIPEMLSIADAIYNPAEARNNLTKTNKRLTDKGTGMMYAYFNEKTPQKEIAKNLGVSQSTVSTHYARWAAAQNLKTK